MTSNDLMLWTIDVRLIKWDVLYALGFTSYKTFENYVNKHSNGIDEIREILVRLYKVEPSLPVFFVAPGVGKLIDFVFNIDELHPAAAENRKTFSSYLSVLLGRNRATGYRWAKGVDRAENLVPLEVVRLCGKLFSMDPRAARSYFWRATLATARARQIDTSSIEQVLEQRGISDE